MWTRAQLKTRAKEILKISYGKAFLVSLILMIIGGDSGLGMSNNRWNNNSDAPINIDFSSNSEYISEMLPYIIYGASIAIAIALAALALRIFIGYVIEVGGKQYFKQAAQTDINLSYLGYGFKENRYLDIVKAMLYKGVLNFLWFLLLIIPGIIKTYAYSMVPYILADNPHIGHARALELSNKMTEGHKFDMFVLDLSFLGWYILGGFLIIGGLFVKPYENATKAELYLVLRQIALEQSYCTAEELELQPTI